MKQVTGEPSASIETCAPPPVISLTASATFSVPRALIAATAPSVRANASFSSEMSMAMGLAPSGRGDHDRRKTDAAAAVHRHPFTASDAGLVGDRPEGCGEAAAEAGGGRKIHALRQVHEVLLGEVECDIFGEGTPMGEARLELRLADLLVAGAAFAAAAAAGNEGHGHPVADLVVEDAAPGGGDRSGQFVAGHMRQADVRVVPHPAVPVAAAEPGRLDLDDDAVFAGRRIGQRPDFRRLLEGIVIHRFHRRSVSIFVPLFSHAVRGGSTMDAMTFFDVPIHPDAAFSG
ncbi:hypothetical protein ABIA16_003201 [Sinorhizobium fredii]